jgi:Tfp pilus assembly protein PilN
MAYATIQTRLCPHCANSIAVDALNCPYCKADLVLSIVPEWPKHNEDVESVDSPPEKEKLTVRSKAILVVGLLLFALGVYLVGGNRERSDLEPRLAEQQRGLVERDEKIQSLEAQLAQLRQDHQGSRNEIASLKTKLEETQKEMAAARKRLSEANRGHERLASSRAATQRPAPRAADSLAAPPSPARARRAIEPGNYETMRAAPVYEKPAGSARVVTRIAKGTQVTVVRSIGEWLEIRSKHDNPPGFLRADDVSLISKSN